MIPTPDDLSAIAGRLTEAERRAVLWPMDYNHPRWSNRLSCWGDRGIAYSLFRLGLTVAPATLVRLTPLGRAVRNYLSAHLQEAGDADVA